MFTSLLSTIITGFIAVALSSGVALHDTRFDKVFALTASLGSDASQHDMSQAMNHELHIHDSSQSSSQQSDPLARARSHRKYTALPHVRVRLASLLG